jgi:phosphodiesterase/alkaline phosphatase D-like protein
VYNMTSRVRDLDFVVFLGDWIYEYGNDEYPPAGQGELACNCVRQNPQWIPGV